MKQIGKHSVLSTCLNGLVRENPSFKKESLNKHQEPMFQIKNNNNIHIEKLEPKTGHFMTTSGKVACTTPKWEELEEKDSEFLSSDNVDQQMHAAKEEDTSIEIGNGQQANWTPDRSDCSATFRKVNYIIGRKIHCSRGFKRRSNCWSSPYWFHHRGQTTDIRRLCVDDRESTVEAF